MVQASEAREEPRALEGKPIVITRYQHPEGDDEVKLIDAVLADAALCGCQAHADTVALLTRYRAIIVRQHEKADPDA